MRGWQAFPSHIAAATSNTDVARRMQQAKAKLFERLRLTIGSMAEIKSEGNGGLWKAWKTVTLFSALPTNLGNQNRFSHYHRHNEYEQSTEITLKKPEKLSKLPEPPQGHPRMPRPEPMPPNDFFLQPASAAPVRVHEQRAQFILFSLLFEVRSSKKCRICHAIWRPWRLRERCDRVCCG